MNNRFLLIFIFFMLAVVLYVTSGPVSDTSGASNTFTESENATRQQAAQQIRDTLARQDAAWNRGDIDAFMQDYLKTDDLRFASDGTIRRGWDATLERYHTRYPDRATMGQLSFTDLEIDVLSPTDALVFGRWKLERETDTPGGLFTLHMKYVEGRWVIASDHTSSGE